MYAFAKFAALTFVLPPAGPIFLVVAGLIVGARRPRLGRGLATFGVVALWLSATPLLVAQLIAKFGIAQPVDMEEAKRAQAIVVLAGGVRRHAQEYGGDTLGRLTLERVRYGATLARQTGLPLLVTGGVPPKVTRSEAALMRQALEVEFKTEVRWVEDKSANTHQNAINSAALLQKDGVERILLVTHAFDAPRARRRFEQAGFKVVPAPTQLPATTDWDLRGLLPSASAISDSFYLGYEALATAADFLLPDR